MAFKEKIASVISQIKIKALDFFKQGDRDVQLFLYILIIILINVAAVRLNARFDLTRNDTYSLSERSRRVVSDLKENLKIRVVFSKDLPAEHKSLYRYLIDLLEEYDYYGNKYFSYTVVDDDELEQEASNFGIRPMQSQEFVDDQVKVRKTYMGLVIQQADLVEKIPAITSPTGLEFQITSLIMKMSGKISGLLNLKEGIALNLYLDSRLKDLPIENINKVEDIVSEAVEKSNKVNYNRIKLQVVDTSQIDQETDLQRMYGIKKIPWKGGVLKSGVKKQSGEGYLGIVLKSGDRFSVIELDVLPTLFRGYVVSGLENIEDRINEAVDSIVSTNPRVAYVTGHGEPSLKDERSREGAGLMNRILSDLYEVKEVDLTKDEIPGDTAAIIINGPRLEFSDYELFKIDQYLMKGKSAVVFLDSFQEVQMGGQQNYFNQQQPMVLPLNTKLEKLLQSYGITVNRDIVLDKNCAKANMGSAIMDYPVVPIITADGMDSKSVITGKLNGAAFIKASSIDIDEKIVNENRLTAVKLVSSSPESWLMKGRIDFSNPMMMQARPDEAFKSYALSVLVTGPLESYFKDKDIPVNEQAKDKKSGRGITEAKLDKTIESGSTRLIVTGTSEITRSGFLMNSRRILAGGGQGQAGDAFSNGVLLHNMVDFVMGNEYVPEMKAKSLEYNPLEKTGDHARMIFKGINIAGVPLLVIIAGFIVWRMRWARRQKIQQEFAS